MSNYDDSKYTLYLKVITILRCLLNISCKWTYCICVMLKWLCPSRLYWPFMFNKVAINIYFFNQSPHRKFHRELQAITLYALRWVGWRALALMPLIMGNDQNVLTPLDLKRDILIWLNIFALSDPRQTLDRTYHRQTTSRHDKP